MIFCMVGKYMTDYEILLHKIKEKFNDAFACLPEDINGKYIHTLKEEKKSAMLQRLTIYDVFQNSILFDLKKVSRIGLGSKMKNIWKDASGLFKCCDYLLLFNTENYLNLIFIEMKSMNTDYDDISKQFKGAYCFMTYINTILEQFFSFDEIKNMQINVHKIIFSKARLNKQPTKASITTEFDFIHHPVRVSKDKSASIYFKKLCAGMF